MCTCTHIRAYTQLHNVRQANRELEAAARTDVAKKRATDRRRRRESMVGRAIEKRRFAEIDAENEALARYVYWRVCGLCLCVLACVIFVSVCA